MAVGDPLCSVSAGLQRLFDAPAECGIVLHEEHVGPVRSAARCVHDAVPALFLGDVERFVGRPIEGFQTSGVGWALGQSGAHGHGHGAVLVEAAPADPF